MGISFPSPNHIPSPKEPSAHFKQLSKEINFWHERVTSLKAESSWLVKLPGDLVICSLNRKHPSPNHIQSLKLWHAWVEKRSLRGLGQVKSSFRVRSFSPLAGRWQLAGAHLDFLTLSHSHRSAPSANLRTGDPPAFHLLFINRKNSIAIFAGSPTDLLKINIPTEKSTLC